MNGILPAAIGVGIGPPGLSPSDEVQQLGSRVAACADRTDAVLAKLAQLQMNEWKSPAGRAYRTTIALQAASLRRGRDSLTEAAAATFRHSQNVMAAGPQGF